MLDISTWQELPEGYELECITSSDGTHPEPSCDHLIDTPLGRILTPQALTQAAGVALGTAWRGTTILASSH
jgi:hypothetical protein